MSLVLERDRKILLFLIVLFLSLGNVPSLQAETFSFGKDLENWGIWGEGSGRHVAGLGHSGMGAVVLTCNQSQTVTMHRNFTLKPGRYKITAWLRALDVQAGQWDYSIWLFYQTAEEIASPVTNLKGTFEWSKVTYTIEVNERSVDIWFRLRAQGSLWLDDIGIEPYSGVPISFQFEKSTHDFPKPNPIGQGVRCRNCYRWLEHKETYCTICGEKLENQDDDPAHKGEVAPVRKLLDFEDKDRDLENKRHYIRKFSNKLATSGKQSAIIRFAEYNSLIISDQEMKNWSGYDYLAMDVYNPLTEQVKFAVCIIDREGGGYWDQLNHYTTLAPGWNYLRFEVNRYVGERGSVRNKRYLDLAGIKNAWFAVAPEDKRKVDRDFYIDNIRLTQAPRLSAFPELYAFDFVKESFRTQRGFTGIESRHSYSKDIGFGFVDAKIWRAHDSLYADTLHRDGIFINKGGFRVDVPNGRYVVRLVPFALGEWNERFWTKRRIEVQGQSILDEQRSTAADYLKDYLRFQDVEPRPDDNAFDLYLTKIFKELVTEVEVDNGNILIDCEGDDSGIMLNSLLIYPVENKEQGEQYVQSMRAVQKDEFDTLCRHLSPDPVVEAGAISEVDNNRGFCAALIGSDNQLRYNQIFKSRGARIELRGGHLERPVQALMLRNLTPNAALVTIASSTLRTRSGREIQPRSEWLRYGVNQYQSHSLNHETYELAPRFLREIKQEGLELAPDFSILVWYQVPLTETIEAGEYSGTLAISMNGQQITYPVTLQVDDYTLPPADIAVGFFGVDPVGFDYFNGAGVDAIKRKNRSHVLQALQERGFTTWSSLPFGQFEKSGTEWFLETDEIDALMSEARKLGFKQKVFTYGGNTPLVMDQDGAIDGMPQSLYRQKTAAVLQEHIDKGKWLPIVFDISDEATGYSQMVDRDVRRAEMLERYYPSLRRGGYSHPIEAGQPGFELNEKFTDISFSSIDDRTINRYRQEGKKWGLYNQSTGLFVNNRKAFGKDLIEARSKGCDHLLEWHLVLAQNYPYYDLDGREHDAMMIFPRLDGGFDFALKFEWAAQGLEEYRLMLLNKLHKQK